MIELYTLGDAEKIIAKNLHRLRQFETIIGIPRSGMIFASFIATQLGVSLADVSTAARSYIVAKHGYVQESEKLGKILLVEDVVNTGKCLDDAFKTLEAAGIKREQVTTCSIWTNPNNQPSRVDIDLGGPHAQRYAFTWQMWHSALWPHWATDFDGVLCQDSPHALKAEKEYLEWMPTAIGRWLPRPRRAQKWPIGAIITSRPESTRRQTERWLELNGVVFNRLIMVPAGTQLDVKNYLAQNSLTRGRWKALQVQQLMREGAPIELFLESDDAQAQEISKCLPGVMVWCTDSQTKYRR